MPTWRNVADVYEDYEQQKGFFRKLFNSRSEFMAFLSTFVAGKNTMAELSAEETRVLLVAVLQIPGNLYSHLSYQLAKRLVGYCMPQGVDSSLFRLCRLLYDGHLFSLNHWNIFYPYRDRQDFATDFLSVHRQLTRMRIQEKLTLLLTTDNHHSPEKGLATLFLLADSRDKAIDWYKKAIDAGQPVSADEIRKQQHHDLMTIDALAQHYESRRWPLALSYYIFLGEKNHAPALRKLTEFYYRGHAELPVDIDAAIRHYRHYLESESSPLMQSLTYLLSELWEELLVMDEKAPVLDALFQLVAVLAQHTPSLIQRKSPSWHQALGYLFLQVNNLEKAQHWYQEAIDQGEAQSLDLAFFTKAGKPAQLLYLLAQLNEAQQPKTALRCYEKAADLDSVESLLRLGELYQANALGILPNERAAFTYYERAEGLGCLQATPALKRLTQEMAAKRDAPARITLSQDPWSIWSNTTSSDDDDLFEYDNNTLLNRLLT